MKNSTHKLIRISAFAYLAMLLALAAIAANAPLTVGDTEDSPPAGASPEHSLRVSYYKSFQI